MPLKKLFLAHASSDAPELSNLATHLRLHGIVPWIDKDGGFAVGDHSEEEARRAIREDCFGLLLYATRDSFNRPFIRDVEIDEAKTVKAANDHFALFAVPRRLTFPELRRLSLLHFDYDLAPYHTFAIPSSADFHASISHVSCAVLHKFLSLTPTAPARLQFSTRDLLPDDADDLLCVNATHLSSCPYDNAAWQDLISALKHVKAEITSTLGRPHLHVHGSKHLSAAFVFGRVFAPFHLHIRQTPNAVWSTDSSPSQSNPLPVSYLQAADSSSQLFVEISAGRKNVALGVDEFIASTASVPPNRLQFQPSAPVTMDNASCLAAVQQVYSEIERIMRQRPVLELHIFAAMPQSFMMMLGRAFKGMPSTRLYEWVQDRYVAVCLVPAGVL